MTRIPKYSHDQLRLSGEDQVAPSRRRAAGAGPDELSPPVIALRALASVVKGSERNWGMLVRSESRTGEIGQGRLRKVSGDVVGE